jgi:hypothetical protein
MANETNDGGFYENDSIFSLRVMMKDFPPTSRISKLVRAHR